MKQDSVSRIVAFLDGYLIGCGKEYVNPIKANCVLESVGLLKDSSERPGLPLRRLLRSGLLPHAIQPDGKRGRWYIPLSKPVKHLS